MDRLCRSLWTGPGKSLRTDLAIYNVPHQESDTAGPWQQEPESVQGYMMHNGVAWRQVAGCAGNATEEIRQAQDGIEKMRMRYC